MSGCIKHERYSDDHLLVITGYNCDEIHSINGVFLVVITGISGHNWFVGIKQAQNPLVDHHNPYQMA
jgi:hypothetical protein